MTVKTSGTSNYHCKCKNEEFFTIICICITYFICTVLLFNFYFLNTTCITETVSGRF